MQESFEKFNPITTGLIARDEEDRILNLAVLTAEHTLLVGMHGTAKSLQADLFFSQLEGKYFKASLSKFSTEEVFFGVLNISKLRQGQYEFCYTNSILDSYYAFIDELFDASDALLRSLLPVLNERSFVRGKVSVKCPLITAIATANYQRVNEVTKALIDRFLFQWYIKPLEGEELKKLFEFKVPEFDQKIPLSAVYQAQKSVDIVDFPSHLRDVFIDLCQQFQFSPRRVFKAIRVCKASALLNHRDTVTAEDLLSLRYLVSTDPQQISDATATIKDVTVIAQRAYEQNQLLDSLEDWWYSVEPEDDTDVQHLKEEAEIIKKLKAIDPTNDEVAYRKQKMLKQYQHHYEKYKKTYLQEQGLI